MPVNYIDINNTLFITNTFAIRDDLYSGQIVINDL